MVVVVVDVNREKYTRKKTRNVRLMLDNSNANAKSMAETNQMIPIFVLFENELQRSIWILPSNYVLVVIEFKKETNFLHLLLGHFSVCKERKK